MTSENNLITMTRKQAEDIITLVEKNTRISKGVVLSFLKTKLEEPAQTKTYSPQPKPDFCNSDLT